MWFSYYTLQPPAQKKVKYASGTDDCHRLLSASDSLPTYIITGGVVNTWMAEYT